MTRRYGLSLLLVATLASGCTGRGQTQAREERRQFQIVMETKLAQLEQRTDALSLERADSAAVAGAGEIEDLRRSQREFREQVATLADAPESKWSEVKTAMESQYLDLEKRYAELADTVRQESVRLGADSSGVEGR